MPDAATAADRIDAIVTDIIDRRDIARACALMCRAQADNFDAEADALNAEIADWNAIRSAAVVASAADRILEATS